MKLLIVTTSKATLKWRSLNEKKTDILQALNLSKNSDWEIDIIYRDIKPEVKDGRVTHEWFNNFSYPLFKQGNHFIGLHMSLSQKKDWGINPNLRGSNQRDDDFVGEFYFWAGESTRRGSENQFVQTCLHEVSHEIANTTNVPDQTHSFHNENDDISPLFSTYDMALWQPKYQTGIKIVSLLEKILNLLLLRKKKVPIKFFTHPVSQEYGVYNKAWYPQTHHHIGTDFATPVNTPIIAPWPCKVTSVGESTTLGHWCEVYDGFYYYYFMHLNAAPMLGVRETGWVIGFTGNSGQTTGPHCHMEGWLNHRDISTLTPSNFTTHTFDVTKMLY